MTVLIRKSKSLDQHHVEPANSLEQKLTLDLEAFLGTPKLSSLALTSLSPKQEFEQGTMFLDGDDHGEMLAHESVSECSLTETTEATVRQVPTVYQVICDTSHLPPSRVNTYLAQLQAQLEATNAEVGNSFHFIVTSSNIQFVKLS